MRDGNIDFNLNDNQDYITFRIIEAESNLNISVDRDKFNYGMIKFAQNEIKKYRNEIIEYIKRDKLFKISLVAHKEKHTSSSLIKEMCINSRVVNVGPMACVAGIIAEKVGKSMLKKYQLSNVIVDNGGDIYIDSNRNIRFGIFAGESILSMKIKIEIDKDDMPIGIATSSGTIGHALSFGKANAVVIMAKDAGLADAYATYYCNQVKSKESISNLINKYDKENILGMIIILDDTIGLSGRFKVSR